MNLYWCIIIAQSPFYSLRFTLDALHSMYIFNNCMMVCVLQNSFTPLNVLSPLPTDPSVSTCCGQSLSLVQLFATIWTAPCQSSLSFTIFQSLLKLMSIESAMPSNLLILCCPLLLLLKSFPASGSFLVSQLFPSDGQNIGASTSASVLSMNIQGWSPCSPRDSQESSPTPQFKSINSSARSLLYCPTLTFIHDCWKNHSFDYMDLCRQSNVCAF